MYRIIVKNDDLVYDNHIVIKNPDTLKHYFKVVALKVGEVAELFTLDYIYECSVKSINKQSVELSTLSKRKINKEDSRYKITLYQCMPKGQKLDIIVQKVTELGVDRIVFLNSQRSVAKIDDADKKMLRIEKIIEEAVVQSKRETIPTLDIIKGIKEIEEDYLIVPYEAENKINLKKILLDFKKNSSSGKNSLGIIIGPEGGFAEEEIKYLKSIGAKICTLGKNILRTETAAISVMAMVKYELEQ